MGLNWFQRQRLDWITEALNVFGYVQRIHLQRKFGISQPQASNDLTMYRMLHPAALVYNTATKRYEATGKWD